MAKDTTNEQNVARTEAERKEDDARRRFGGLNVGAAIYGWLVANSISILLLAILAAAGGVFTLSAQPNASSVAQSSETISIISAAILLVIMAVAYYAGGYVAGRMSRFDGGKQGFGVWAVGIVIAILLVAAGAILGARFNVLQQLNLPTLPVDGSQLTITGVITLLVVLIATLLAAIGGGKIGERYHHKVDKVAIDREKAVS